MRSDDAVAVTTVVAVDPATAFELFTRDVDTWWRRGPRYRVDPERPSTMRFSPPRVGGRFLEVYDAEAGDAYEHGPISSWEPGRRLVFQMRGRDLAKDESTEVEVRFEPEGDGARTRVIVHHRGFARFPADHPVRHGLEGPAFTALMGAWWGDLLVSLAGARGRG